MHSMGKPCSKSVSRPNLALLPLFRYETSVHSCFFSVSILRPIRPGTMNKTAQNIVACKIQGNQ